MVVLDWDGGADALAAVESVVETAPEALLVFVDNASAAPVVGEVARRWPAAVVVRNQTNLGYAGGNNRGIRAALEAGRDRVLVLNNDARLRSGALASMCQVADEATDVGVVGARILDSSDPQRVSMAWGEISWQQSLVRLPGAGKPSATIPSATRDVEWVSGAAILLCADRLAKAGVEFFDENFFAYHEEVDLCVRVAEAGLRVCWCGAAEVEHAGEASSAGGYVSRKQYFVGRNMLLFARRHGTLAQRAKFLSMFFGSLPFQWLRRSLTGEAAGVGLKWAGALDALRDRPLPRAALGLDRRAGNAARSPR